MLSFLRFTPVGQRLPNGAAVILTSELQFKTSTKRDLDSTRHLQSNRPSDRHDRSSDRSEPSSSNSRRPSDPAKLDSTDTSNATTVVSKDVGGHKKLYRKRISYRSRPFSRPTFVVSLLLFAFFSAVLPLVRSVNVSADIAESEGGYGETTADIAGEYNSFNRCSTWRRVMRSLTFSVSTIRIRTS